MTSSRGPQTADVIFDFELGTDHIGSLFPAIPQHNWTHTHLTTFHVHITRHYFWHKEGMQNHSFCWYLLNLLTVEADTKHSAQCDQLQQNIETYSSVPHLVDHRRAFRMADSWLCLLCTSLSCHWKTSHMFAQLTWSWTQTAVNLDKTPTSKYSSRRSN